MMKLTKEQKQQQVKNILLTPIVWNDDKSIPKIQLIDIPMTAPKRTFQN